MRLCVGSLSHSAHCEHRRCHDLLVEDLCEHAHENGSVSNLHLLLSLFDLIQYLIIIFHQVMFIIFMYCRQNSAGHWVIGFVEEANCSRGQKIEHAVMDHRFRE